VITNVSYTGGKKMLVTREYTVKINTNDVADPFGSRELMSVLDRELPGGVVAESVTHNDPENDRRTTKIPAIKRIRALTDVRLMDAKFLVDTAYTLGEAKWSGVTVTYHYDTGDFSVQSPE
jgi:hypothetical protein